MIFHAVAFSFNDHCFGVMEEPIQDGRGEHAVVIEDFRPLIESSVGCDDDRAPFVALTDDLEEEVSVELVDG